MNIKTVAQSSISYGELKDIKLKSEKNYWDIYQEVGVRAIANKNNFYVIEIDYTINRYTLDRHLSSVTTSVFEVESESINFIPHTESEIYLYADLIQMSASYARLVFYEQCEEIGLKNQFLRVDPIQKIAESVRKMNIQYKN